MISQLTETNECETAAGQPGRAVIVLLILATMLVVATSVVIAVRGTDFVNPGAFQSAPPPAVATTFTVPVTKSARTVVVAARRLASLIPDKMAQQPVSPLVAGRIGI